MIDDLEENNQLLEEQILKPIKTFLENKYKCPITNFKLKISNPENYCKTDLYPEEVNSNSFIAVEFWDEWEDERYDYAFVSLDKLDSGKLTEFDIETIGDKMKRITKKEKEKDERKQYLRLKEKYEGNNGK
jgi:hypothetical protein